MKRFKDLKEVKEVGDDPCNETPPEELVKVGTKVVAKKKPFEEASSAAVKLQKAFLLEIKILRIKSPRILKFGEFELIYG